jgi:hypothetical protein
MKGVESQNDDKIHYKNNIFSETELLQNVRDREPHFTTWRNKYQTLCFQLQLLLYVIRQVKKFKDKKNEKKKAGIRREWRKELSMDGITTDV